MLFLSLRLVDGGVVLVAALVWFCLPTPGGSSGGSSVSGDLSLDDLHAASDVVWDFVVSADLAGGLDAAAATVRGRVGPRNSRRDTYGTEFRGLECLVFFGRWVK